MPRSRNDSSAASSALSHLNNYYFISIFFKLFWRHWANGNGVQGYRHGVDRVGLARICDFLAWTLNQTLEPGGSCKSHIADGSFWESCIWFAKRAKTKCGTVIILRYFFWIWSLHKIWFPNQVNFPAWAELDRKWKWREDDCVALSMIYYQNLLNWLEIPSSNRFLNVGVMGFDYLLYSVVITPITVLYTYEILYFLSFPLSLLSSLDELIAPACSVGIPCPPPPKLKIEISHLVVPCFIEMCLRSCFKRMLTMHVKSVIFLAWNRSYSVLMIVDFRNVWQQCLFLPSKVTFFTFEIKEDKKVTLIFWDFLNELEKISKTLISMKDFYCKGSVNWNSFPGGHGIGGTQYPPLS